MEEIEFVKLIKLDEQNMTIAEVNYIFGSDIFFCKILYQINLIPGVIIKTWEAIIFHGILDHSIHYTWA